MGVKRALLIGTLLFTFSIEVQSRGNDFVEVAINDSLRHLVFKFGQLADLSHDARRKQMREASANEQGEALFRELFSVNSQADPTNEGTAIFNFVHPQLDIASCYSPRNFTTKQEIWDCISEKRAADEAIWRLSIDEYILLITKYYSKAYSYIGVPLSPEEIGMNKIDPMAIIDVVEESKVKLSKTRFQKVAAAPIAFSGDWLDPDFANGRNSSYIIREDYNCKLIFYISFDVVKDAGKRLPINFKIDSISHLPPILDVREMVAQNEKSKSRKK
jgi:hypothetical protein